jgi:putative PIN family toxin of toxin-antitoxin system
MLDTNTLVSAIVFNGKAITEIINTLEQEQLIVLCTYVLDELHSVITRKFPHKSNEMWRFLYQLQYELVYTPPNIQERLFTIRDDKDYPILYTAIKEDVDILVSGDKDFADIDIERPEILTPSEFLEKY